jgi:SOS response regulatory protein OraA/RecX
MIDIAKATKLLETHFASVTPDEFTKNLREFCPELFEDQEKANSGKELIENTEIYRQAQKNSKLEIAPKLLQRGFSIEEVAAILEIDASLLAS